MKTMQPPTFKGQDGEPEFIFAPLRLVRTAKSKNGYYVYLGDQCVLTSGPIKIEPLLASDGKPTERVNVTLTLAVWDVDGTLDGDQTRD